MAITNNDLKKKLLQFDEETVCELLEISTEDLLDRFEDRIDFKYEKLQQEFEADLFDGSDQG